MLMAEHYSRQTCWNSHELLMSIPIGYGEGARENDVLAEILPSIRSLPMSLDPAAFSLVATLAEAGSLTAAARVLGCTQPALTKQLRRFEASLGVLLFQRSLRGVEPTAYGATLLPRARIVRDQIRQATEEIAQLRGLREGRIMVAASHLATIVLLPEVMRSFRARWPDVVVHVVAPAFPDRFVGLREGTPDLAVINLPGGLGPEFQVTPLISSTVVAIVRRGHPLAQAESLAALAQAEWVMPNASGSSARMVRTAFQRARLPVPRCPVYCETLTGLVRLVSGSDLVGVLPAEVFEALPAGSGLVRLPLEISPRSGSLSLIRWADARPTPAAADLAALFVSVARRFTRQRAR